MNLSNITELIKTTTTAVKMRRQTMGDAIRKIVAQEVHRKQFERAEEDLVNNLELFFKEQRKEVAKQLDDLGEISSVDQIMDLIYNPRDWDAALVDSVFPHLLKSSGEAAIAQFLLMGIDVRIEKSAKPSEKTTTATEWLEDYLEEAAQLAGETFSTVGGNVGLSFVTEWPLWMRDEIVSNLALVFKEDYWKKINETTSANIQRILERGLEDGQSIRDMAKALVEDGLDEFYHGRAKNIARTESANALNSARKVSIERLMEEVPQLRGIVQQTWMSVLGSTTRADHADLDGVPADGDGMWFLGGVRIPWPGHFSLSIDQRANCQCSIQHAFGMEEQEAQELIDDFNERTKAKWELEEKNLRDVESTKSKVLLFNKTIGDIVQEKLSEVQLIVPPGSINLNLDLSGLSIPTPQVDVHVPQQPVPDVRIEQSPITVQAPSITVEAAKAPNVNIDPIINVEAPKAPDVSVEVQSPNITVEAPSVTVEAPNVEAPIITLEAAKAPSVTVEAPVTVQAAKAPDVTVEASDSPKRAVIKHSDGTMSQISLE